MIPAAFTNFAHDFFVIFPFSSHCVQASTATASFTGTSPVPPRPDVIASAWLITDTPLHVGQTIRHTLVPVPPQFGQALYLFPVPKQSAHRLRYCPTTLAPLQTRHVPDSPSLVRGMVACGKTRAATFTDKKGADSSPCLTEGTGKHLYRNTRLEARRVAHLRASRFCRSKLCRFFSEA